MLNVDTESTRFTFIQFRVLGNPQVFTQLNILDLEISCI